MAGQILGVQMGYSLATLFDPQTQADTPVLAEFHRLAALLIFLQLDVHHWLLRALVRSFAYLPAGAAPATFAAATGLLHAAGGIFCRRADCRARPGGHAGGGCGVGISGKSFAAAAGAFHRAGGQEPAGSGRADRGRGVLAAHVFAAFRRVDRARRTAAALGSVKIELVETAARNWLAERIHGRAEQNRETHTAAAAKSARAGTGRAQPRSGGRSRNHDGGDVAGLAVAGVCRATGAACLRQQLDSAATHPEQLLPVWRNDLGIFRGVALAAGLSWLVATVGGVAQGGLVFAPAALAPNLNRLSPASRWGSCFR